MVVVFVTHNYPRFAGDLPGSFLPPLASALRDRGHDVRVVAPADRGAGGREPLAGIPVRRVRYAAPAGETLAYQGRMQEAARSPAGLLAVARLIRALREGVREEAREARGDAVVHAHWWIPAGIAAPPELPTLVTLHGTDGRILQRNPAARWIGRRVLRRARVVTAVSPELAAVVERVTGRRDVSSHVQPMPIDAAAIPWSEGGGGVVVIARLVPQKRVALAIQAAAEMARDGHPVPLTIIGDGPERPALVQLAASLPAVPVRFLGTLPALEVARALGGADLLFFTAENEGLGLAALEALMAGVPVVACTDGGGVVSALRLHGGGIVADPEPAALARAARQARDPSHWTEARQAGARWRSELAPARVAERFEAWYREALRR